MPSLPGPWKQNDTLRVQLCNLVAPLVLILCTSMREANLLHIKN